MMKVIAALSTLLLPPVVLAVVGGRCSGSWDTKWCICLDHNVCRDQFGGDALQGSPGNWPCPNDPDNVMGCRITRNCPTKDFHTACLWRNVGDGCPGVALRDGVCPGGNDFVCCYFCEGSLCPPA